MTIIKDTAGRYFASFVVETTDDPLPPECESEIGIDLGLTTFAVLSNGKTITSPPRFFRQAERRLRKAQQNLSRKEKGSKNRAKARMQVARAHARVRDARLDFAHKQAATLIRENQAVYVEDLCVSGLARTRLAKSVHDAGWGHFHPDAGGQGRPVRAHLRQGGPLVPVVPDLLDVRAGRRAEAVVGAGVDLPVRCGPRPGPECSTQHPRRRTGGEVKRLWSAGKTGTCSGAARRSRYPPRERHAALVGISGF